MKLNLLDILLPRETKFFTYFTEQVDVLIEGSKRFRDLVANLDTLNDEEIKNRLAEIKECELRGDAVEHKIIEELHQTFITPIDREDIHTMAINIDRCLDILNSVSRKIEIYSIRSVPVNVRRFADVIVEIATEMSKLVGALKNRKGISDISQRMHVLENKGDDLFHQSMAELFRDNKNPIDVIRLKELYEHLESVVDCADYIGKLVRGVAVKQG
jgi:predicted phosphate transport protein (TIGR00153 family)